MIEKIIFWLTVFNEREIIERKIRSEYPSLLDEQVKQCLALNYSGWGRLSLELINGMTTFENGQNKTILEVLKSNNKNFNFMQIINSKNYEFKEKLSKINRAELKEITVDDVYELQGSPALKKSIWQSILIFKEIEKIMGYAPSNIYLEFARDNVNKNQKVRTKSRIKKIEECYKELSKISNQYNKENALLLKNIEKDKKYNISEEMIYLYFLQNGKCLYTGRPLDINNLSSNCHVDHIIPRKLIKDNSIENKALVLSTENSRKSDNLTLRSDIISKQRGYWGVLKSSGLMGSKKYYSLTRENFNEKDVQGFIARQLVETRQISVHVKNLLENYYMARKTGTRVKTVKAGISSELRAVTELYKIRELNCFHHAHDAYLSAFIGTFISAKFGRYEDLSDRLKYKNVLSAKGNYIVYSILKNEPIFDEDGLIVWEKGPEKVEKMKKIFNYRDVLVSKKVEESSGEFYNQNLVSKGDGLIPINKNMIGKTGSYGGYSGQQMSSFMIISFKNGKKNILRIIGVPIAKKALMKQGLLTEDEFLVEYLKKSESKADINSVRVVKKFNKYQEVVFDNGKFLFASVQEKNGTGTLHRTNDLILSDKYKKILYGLYNKKAIDRHNDKKGITIYEQITFEELKEVVSVLLNKADKFYSYYSNHLNKINGINYEELEETDKNVEQLEVLIKVLLKALARGISEETVEFEFKTNNGIEEFKLSVIGRYTPSMKNIDNINLITKSVTGFYEHTEVINNEF